MTGCQQVPTCYCSQAWSKGKQPVLFYSFFSYTYSCLPGLILFLAPIVWWEVVSVFFIHGIFFVNSHTLLSEQQAVIVLLCCFLFAVAWIHRG